MITILLVLKIIIKSEEEVKDFKGILVNNSLFADFIIYFLIHMWKYFHNFDF